MMVAVEDPGVSRDATVPVPGGRRASYSVWGTGEECALLLPGGPGMSAKTMFAEAEMLSAIMTCYLVDPPGSGESTPPDSADGYTPTAHAEWYFTVCAAL